MGPVPGVLEWPLDDFWFLTMYNFHIAGLGFRVVMQLKKWGVLNSRGLR